MRRWNDLTEVPPGLSGSVVTIGVFDGVHRGHQHVIGRAVERAREAGVPAVVLTFDPHPMTVVRPELAPPMLATLDHRLELFERYGADAALVMPFTSQRSQQPAEEFVRETAGVLRPRAIVVGDDFRYGHRAAGDVALLETLGAELGFAVEGLPRDEGNADWSSTSVRKALEVGDVRAAADLLGHLFRVDGVVVRGAGRGGPVLGTPTANIPVEHGRAVPADGVYAAWAVRLDDPERTRMPAATSVGTNPQFGEEPRQVEAYIVDREGLDLYGVALGVEFVERVRGQATFESLDDLRAAIRRDVERIRDILGIETSPMNTVDDTADDTVDDTAARPAARRPTE
ncbi:MAG TPA: bifunctional riboflavin kinase/FAD synthetase [Actinopolymorphaceae bacterium]